MTVQLGIPAVVMACGALTYLLAPGKWADLGKMAFAAGLLALLLK